MTESIPKPYVTTNADRSPVVLDRKTGQTRDLTPKEARILAEGLKQLINQSTDGLEQVQRSDGSVSMDLQGRFQDVMLAKKEDDGSISQSCVDNLSAAADFFEIDPALVGLAKRTAQSRPAPTKLEDR